MLFYRQLPAFHCQNLTACISANLKPICNWQYPRTTAPSYFLHFYLAFGTTEFFRRPYYAACGMFVCCRSSSKTRL
ncbi:hypothetical protein XELAEV_18032763mg [Xenopus laevis]|uniref:Uncharacterized protein n=1 Tax=Xenopus laevis TaxID=8355 RepID=A0A974CI07_XENLA|nr:hypothetical protein XELAEV_18032763mg [Xenopus laevis]